MNNASLSTFFFSIVLAYIMTITLGVPEHALSGVAHYVYQYAVDCCDRSVAADQSYLVEI